MSFLGLPYPIVKHPRGFMRTQSGIDQIKADLLVLLLTNPGERVMLPEFGTPLRSLIFEPNDPTLSLQAREMIINSIRTWEPRIGIQAIEVSNIIDKNLLHVDDNQEELEHILSIRISFFDPADLSQIQELKLDIPLSSLG